jgi:uncharacterized protein (DUF305 family)
MSSALSSESSSTTSNRIAAARRLVAVGLVVAAPVVLAACGGDDSATGSTTTAQAASGTPTTAPPSGGAVHNSIDVAFAQGMIPHHAQAVEMSELAATNTSDPEVQALATEIIAAQGPEIALMTEWLTAWGAEVPDPGASMDENMELAGGMMMSGMISDADLDRLRSARDAEFDRLYLELAQRIIDTQQAEITRMEQLLGVSG